SERRNVLVVGAGAFGVAAAVELRQRGHDVTLVDRGPLPHEQASSTDISKLVRMDYGNDEFYFDLAERARTAWKEWNRAGGEELYHEDGLLVMASRPVEPGSFEGDCLAMLRRHERPVERVDSRVLRERFPAWDADRYVDGYLNPRSGWAESGRAVGRLIERAQELGVGLAEGVGCARLHEEGSRVAGIVTRDDTILEADIVIVAAGAWTPALLPELAGSIRTVGQPVLIFRPQDPASFSVDRFPPWTADVTETGFYGFPPNAEGVIKVGNHGPGQAIHPDDPHEVEPVWEEQFRDFLARTFPALAPAQLVKTRLCLYCDTFDGDFWIDHHPDREGLVVACGGSGHGFKFMPVLGPIIADVVEQKPNADASRFRWREPTDEAAGEQSRHR
ncbi:MAG: FAD-dependent oxidoreductase, partial [Actinobacteria bacterium]|nr:FAD-dependent oxidoreductase [Actinomycetota bacterium]NIV56476.1 FAD-dependent oxidoreductase [Actinomycetota bacterium]NIX21724.1 FAD-dependent oxidoreductase [Actinomycetota bacterium]